MAIKRTSSLIFSISLLVSGNLIGAGILGIPISAGLDGFIPSIIAMLVFGVAMFFTAHVICQEVCETKDVAFNYPSLYEKYLKVYGKWIATATNLLILYGLLVAYITGGSQIIASLVGDNIPLILIQIVFFLILTTLTLTGVELVRKCNIFLMVFLWGAFTYLVVIGQFNIVPKRLVYMDWFFLPAALPIILTSFHFHNIIPTISKKMRWNIKLVSIAIIFGMLIGFTMNALWLETGLGMLPLAEGKHSILYSYLNGLPITVQIFSIIQSKIFIAASLTFALLAIVTSYFANGLGLMDFSVDLVYSLTGKPNKYITAIVTFLPPFLISIFYPDIFLKSINVVGGIGIVILFGILPCVISFIKYKNIFRRIITVVFLFLFVFVLLFQIGTQFKIIDIKPAAIRNTEVLSK